MLQIGNYVYDQGHLVKIKELYSQNLLVELEDRTLYRTAYRDIRFIELSGSDVLLRVRDEDKTIFRLIKTTDYELHKKEDWEVNLRGKKFYMHGFLYDDISVWQFSNVITLHYLHQLQNLVKILNPEIEMILI